MSIIGDKIHRIRDFRGMTQKQLGMAVGFDEKSADVRIAQYESGTRTPKQALVEQLAAVLDVNPRFLADDEILGAEGIMMMLFELDEHYPISIEDCEDEDGNKRKSIVFGSNIIMFLHIFKLKRNNQQLIHPSLGYNFQGPLQFYLLVIHRYHLML